MKIAYFIPLHHKLYQLRWLLAAIDSREDLFCFHVDRKSGDAFAASVRRAVGERPNVVFLPRRSVRWGGWSQVAVELSAIDRLLERDASWRYLINLSGQDYPIQSRDTIRGRLADAWPNNFIRAWSFEEIARSEPADPHLRQRLAVEIFGRVIVTPIRRRLSPTLQYKGSQWHMLTRDFCEWLRRDPTTSRIAATMKRTLVPDETFFPALIMNSPWRDARTPDFGRVVIWPGPKTLRMEDYPLLSTSAAMFARKFDELVDRDVLVQLARDYGYAVPQPQQAEAGTGS